jgi:small subunit ribosomal protein S20
LANTRSAKKRVRQNEKRHLRNRIHSGQARTAVKKARIAIARGNMDEAQEAVRLASKWLDHAATKGSLHKNTAARSKSRLMKQLAQMEAKK